jgi:CheY-like chemotaxis protein
MPLLTLHAMAGDRANALAAGRDDFDTRPIEFDRLSGKLKKALANVMGRPGSKTVEG